MSDAAFLAIWRIVWAIGASWTPPPLHGWRRVLLRLFGAKVGHKARVYGSALITDPRHIKLGAHSVVGFGTRIHSEGDVMVDDYANIAQYNLVETVQWEQIEDKRVPIVTSVKFCRSSWIASYCYVGPGVTVGEGAVLGGGGVALESLEPWTVYVGNPARPKRQRVRHVDADNA